MCGERDTARDRETKRGGERRGRERKECEALRYECCPPTDIDGGVPLIREGREIYINRLVYPQDSVNQ